MRVVTLQQQSDSLFSTGEQVVTNTPELTVTDICIHTCTLYMHINNGDETRGLRVLQPSALTSTGLRCLLQISMMGVTSDPKHAKR